MCVLSTAAPHSFRRALSPLLTAHSSKPTPHLEDFRRYTAKTSSPTRTHPNLQVRSTVVSIAPSMLAGNGKGAGGGSANFTSHPPESLRRAITLADFDKYLRTVGEPYRFLAANRPSTAPDAEAKATPSATPAATFPSASADQGETPLQDILL